MSDFWDVLPICASRSATATTIAVKGSKSPLFYPSIHPVLKEA